MNISVRMGDDHKSGIALLLMVLGVVTLWYFKVYERPITNYPAPIENKSIIAFGDALVVGVGAKQLDAGFVSVLEQKTNMEIISFGIENGTVENAWRYINQITALKPRIVILSFGRANTALSTSSPTEVKLMLERIVAEIHRSGSSVILLGIPGYHSMYRDLAREYQTAYVPNVLSDIIGKSEYMFDAMNPNDAGYKKIAEKIYPTLEKLLK